ncbi:MAG: hypothetical protein V4438_03810 [Patescibacteria group bacterium]
MKNQFQDIIPPDKRSIRNIPLPTKSAEQDSGLKETKSVRIKKISKEPSEEEILAHEKNELVHLPPQLPKAPRKKAAVKKVGYSRIFLWSATGLAVVVLFFSITSIFKSADVIVTEKSAISHLSGASTFALNPSAEEAGYSAITVSNSASATLPATGEKQVSSSAVGNVQIYNSGSSVQKLVAGTRLETPSGLIFKLDKAVSVPAASKASAKSVPGSAEASVTAEKPGSDYNIPPTDFTIPGFKGTPKYSTFYGRSKGAMSGGNVGMISKIDDATLARATEDLKAKLYNSLKEKAAAELPNTEQTFDGFDKIVYTVSDPKPENESQPGSAVIKIDAVAKIYAIDINSFARKLLAISGTHATSTDSFDIDFSSVKATFESEDAGTLSATLDGDARIIWKLDVDAWKNAIAGKSVRDMPILSTAFPEIDKVSVTIKPLSLWNPKLPANPSKIHVSLKI